MGVWVEEPVSAASSRSAPLSMPEPRGTEAKLWSSSAPSMLVLFWVEARPRKLRRASESPDWESGLAVGVRRAKVCQRWPLAGRRSISLEVMTLPVAAEEVSPTLTVTAGSAVTLTVVETVPRCRRASTEVVAPTSTTTGGRVRRANRA